MTKPIELLETIVEYDFYELDGIKLCGVTFTITEEQANKIQAINSGECELIKVVREVE